MKNLFLLFLVFITASLLKAQSPVAEIYDPPIPYVNSSLDWGTDLLVSATEPFGKHSGVYRSSNNAIYVAIPDTNILAGKSIVVLRSTNDGANWSITGSINPATIVPKTKMVGREDSIYCFFDYASTIYAWNVVTNNLYPFTTYTNVRDFDAAISSTLSLYLIIDLQPNRDVRLYGSATGGQTWTYAVYLTSTGAHPRFYMSGTGDTLLINYYGVNITADTISSAIRSVRYRESAPGTLALAGTFSTPIAGGVPKSQFQCVMNGGKAWIFYTTGLTGEIDLNCMVSADNGFSFGAPFTIGALPSRDEYWFDAKHYSVGVDLVYYSDSLQAGPATSQTDKLFYSFATYSTPETFWSPVAFSQKPPCWSDRGYIPTLVEYYNTGNDLGVVWVGQDGADRKVYYDRYAAVTRISNNENIVPEDYSLGQNYPNPFNPQTMIDFAIPKNGMVSIILYDVTGKEIATILNREMTKGSYTVDFNASSISTGVYFYKLVSGNFTATKKMMVIK
ncbi:MAG: T9SS type A sorting domain-containing protein [Candidatus Kapaibacterium sp.]